MSLPSRLASSRATYLRMTPRPSSFRSRSLTAWTDKPTFSAISDCVDFASDCTRSRISRSCRSNRSVSLTPFLRNRAAGARMASPIVPTSASQPIGQLYGKNCGCQGDFQEKFTNSRAVFEHSPDRSCLRTKPWSQVFEAGQPFPHFRDPLEVDLPEEQAFPVRSFGDDRAPGIDDHRMTVGRPPGAVPAGLRRRHHEDLVLDRTGAQERLPVDTSR